MNGVLFAMNLRTGKLFPVETIYTKSMSCAVREKPNVTCTIDEGLYELFYHDGDRYNLLKPNNNKQKLIVSCAEAYNILIKAANAVDYNIIVRDAIGTAIPYACGISFGNSIHLGYWELVDNNIHIALK